MIHSFFCMNKVILKASLELYRHYRQCKLIQYNNLKHISIFGWLHAKTVLTEFGFLTKQNPTQLKQNCTVNKMLNHAATICDENWF